MSRDYRASDAQNRTGERGLRPFDERRRVALGDREKINGTCEGWGVRSRERVWPKAMKEISA